MYRYTPRVIERYTNVDTHGTIKLPNLLKDSGLCVSTSDARRMIEQGAVRINGDKVSPQQGIGLEIDSDTNDVYQVGKLRIKRVHVEQDTYNRGTIVLIDVISVVYDH